MIASVNVKPVKPMSGAQKDCNEVERTNWSRAWNVDQGKQTGAFIFGFPISVLNLFAILTKRTAERIFAQEQWQNVVDLGGDG
jgi:hypothetical protein